MSTTCFQSSFQYIFIWLITVENLNEVHHMREILYIYILILQQTRTQTYIYIEAATFPPLWSSNFVRNKASEYCSNKTSK